MMVESYNGYYNENTSVSSAFTPVVVNSYSRLHAYPRTFHWRRGNGSSFWKIG